MPVCYSAMLKKNPRQLNSRLRIWVMSNPYNTKDSTKRLEHYPDETETLKFYQINVYLISLIIINDQH